MSGFGRRLMVGALVAAGLGFSAPAEQKQAPTPGPYAPGFRVQVVASPSPMASYRALALAQRILPAPASIDWEEDLYKVRIGAFETRGEADLMVAALADSIPDAWVVAAVVRREDVEASRRALPAGAERTE